MACKVYIHLELAGCPEKTSKIQIPASWAAKEVKEVIGLFLKAYNDKNPNNQFDIEQVHMEKADGAAVFSNDLVNVSLEDRCDYYIKHGPCYRELAAKETSGDPAKQKRCKNYGCNQYYNEDENTEESCVHHVAPPIFHDTMKCWSCCKDKKAYDFESFQAIAGCTVGRHCDVPKKVAIAASPNQPAASMSGSLPPAPVLKSIADYNTQNPHAASAASMAAKTIARRSSRNADGLTAKCQRKGCQKTFTIAENKDDSCRYHKGQPIFHDALKFWSCCAEKKCLDFDDFLAVPGCAVGNHDDGEGNLIN